MEMKDVNHFLSKLDILVVGSATISRTENLEEYLKNKVNVLAFIAMATHLSPRIHCTFYNKGKVAKKFGLSMNLLFLPTILTNFASFISISFLTLRSRTRFDVYIGVGSSIHAFVGLILRKLNIIRFVIYYSYDFYLDLPKIYAALYRIIDRICIYSCDVTWNLSPGLIELRKRVGIIKEDTSAQLIVPLGVNAQNIRCRALNEIDRTSIGFIGNLRVGHGLELFFDALSEIVKVIPDARLKIIGSGLSEELLKRNVKEKKLEKNVLFFGYVSDSKAYDILSKCAISVAPYVPALDNFTRYVDPGKPKAYLSCGLPVIITKVPQIAFEIEKNKAGFAINYDKKEMTDAVVKLLTNEEMLQEYRKNATQLAMKYDLENIFNLAFAEMAKILDAHTHKGG